LNYKPLDPNKTYLVTGAAGFIGYYLSKRLLNKGCRVIGVDNINDYYDVNLKFARLKNGAWHHPENLVSRDVSQ
jgi:UDP-glucuronate 4-epimerase